jgi:hypothetical protein
MSLTEDSQAQNTFRLKNGELVLDAEKIVVHDDVKRQYSRRLFSSGMWTLYGTFVVLRHKEDFDTLLFWTGLFIGVAHFVLLVLTLFQTPRSEIAWKEIQSVKVARPFRNKYISIRLRNGRSRIVQPLKGKEEELCQHIAARIQS